MSQQIDNNNTATNTNTSTTTTKQYRSKTSPLTCIDDYELHRSLGKGSMGKVKLGVHLVTGEKV